MYAVILAGGSGTRLWPLSREKYPKQYLQLPFTGPDSSLFEATLERVTHSIAPEKILIVTHRDQSSEIRRRLADKKLEGPLLIEEPQARNTAPAIGLAAWYLNKKAGPQNVMAVLPSDHLIPDREGFAALLEKGAGAAANYGLVTFGIRPTGPETGYGYILCGEKMDHSAYRVEKFVEKPDLPTARQYLENDRYLWNSGMFAFSVEKLVDQYRLLLPEMAALLDRVDYESFSNLESIYGKLEKISVDYAILERSSAVTVIPTAIGWSDVGSWESCYLASPKDDEGNSSQGRVIVEGCRNNLVINASPSRLVGAVGINDLVVVDTPDALLVCHRSSSQDVKKIAEKLKAENAPEAEKHLTIYRPWGSFTTLELSETYQVKRIEVNPGARLSLQSHNRRAEHWVVVEGEALVTVDEALITVKSGETVYVPQQARHRMENKGEKKLVLIEVQNGDYLGEDDIVRYEDDYGRVESSGPGKSSALSELERWLAKPDLDPRMGEAIEIIKNDPVQVENHFGRNLVFGTGGMRGITGPGINRINRYVVRRNTQGLADYLNSKPPLNGTRKVAIAYDTRHYSAEFAREAALVLAANGIKALLFNNVKPTPLLSYATRKLGCAAGIVITASHNPPQYNGYKVYGPDGGQAVSPFIDELIAAIESIDIFEDVKAMTREEAIRSGLFKHVDPAFDRVYLDRVRSLSLSRPSRCIKVVFTPLHGTGSAFIPGILSEMGCVDLYTVEEQMKPDPNFSTVKVPNPEDPAALKMALEKAGEVGADIVMATDPDGDRVGTAVPSPDGGYRIISGNQMGALLLEYICSRLHETGAMPARPVMITTVVTGDLGRRVAESHGLEVIETLTGFKFMGQKIKEFEEEGGPDFVFGFEESVGYLVGTFVRDKDAVIASMLIAEMTAYYLEQGKTLLDLLEELHRRHGYHSDELLTIELSDINKADRHVAVYRDLPSEFAGQKVIEKHDFDRQQGWNFENGTGFKIDLPRSQVLRYVLADHSWFAVRPSGTEPKVKFYLSANGPTAAEADEKLARLKKAVLEQQ